MNKQTVEKVVSALGFKIGCWDRNMNELSKGQLQKVLGNIEYQNDTDVTIKRKAFVVEIDIVGDEVDFSILSKAEYINTYGDERYV